MAENHPLAGSITEGAQQRARRDELEKISAATRLELKAAKERRDFLREETKEGRDYSTKLTAEKSRLKRIEESLTSDQQSTLKELRSLVAHVHELERKEESANEHYKTKEAELRAEINDFVGNQRSVVSTFTEIDDELSAGKGRTSDILTKGTVIPLDDPLGGGDVTDKGSHDKQSPSGQPEGEALLSQGLLKLETAHAEALAERDDIAGRLSRLRLAVARRQREEDQFPEHAELLQYLHRFDELGTHAIARVRQLRTCRSERLTLALTRDFLAGEARALETIANEVEAACKQKQSRGEYMQRLEDVIESVEDSRNKQLRLVDSANKRRRAAEETQQSIAQERKRFLVGARELAEACYHYDALTRRLDGIRHE